ncbi:mitochondrial large ribosomal subunit [Coemansia sp. Benny D115]|nr:mitochondrial large ribosomal subunit [Coemansia sp. Benny D115]
MLGLFTAQRFANARSSIINTIIPRAFNSTATAAAVETTSETAAQKLVQYPYFIRRTRFHSLPVYRKVKNGGTRKLIIIRRIEGDIEALRTDLAEALQGAPVAVRKVSQQVVVTGDRMNDVRAWLSSKGF